MNAYPLRILCTASLCLSLISEQECNAQVSSCTNADFELGNLSGWSGTTGYCCPINTTVPGFVAGRHTIVTGGTDPNTGNLLSQVAPGGSYSVRLGNGYAGGEAEQIKYTFLVTPQTQLFVYRYAVVLQDPGHVASAQPRFQITVADQNGVIDYTCGYYSVVSAPGLAGFNTFGSVHWRNWTTNAIDLTSKLGSTITITFSTGDCGYGGHFGYAYIDCMCYPFNVAVDFCAGALFANLTAPPGFVSYLWSTGQTTTSITISNGNAGDTISVTMTSVTGCPVTLHSIIRASLIADFTFGQACEGNAIPFYDNSQFVGGVISSWQWDFGDGSPVSTIKDPVHVYNVAGNYTVTLIVTEPAGCSDTVYHPVTVLNSPVAAFTTTPACPGSNMQCTDLSTITGSTINVHLWNFGDNTSFSLLTNPQHIYSLAGAYNITYILFAANGCKDTLIQTIQTSPLPVPVLNATSGCPFSPLLFYSSSYIIGGHIDSTYWSYGDSTGIESGLNTTHIYSAPGYYDVTLTAVSDVGCINSVTNQVLVNEIPQADFISDTVCIGQPSIFINQTPTTPVISYFQWNTGDNNLYNGGDTLQHQYQTDSTYFISLIAVSDSGCIDTVTHAAIVNPLPDVNFLTTGALCENDTIQFNSTSVSQAGIVQSQWIFSDGQSANGVITTHQFATGQHINTLIITDNNGCVDSVSNLINVHPDPLINFTTDNVCDGVPAYFYGIVNCLDPVNIYNWDFGDSTTAPLINTNHLFATPGKYTITFQASSIIGCTSTISKLFTVYPNPVAAFSTGISCEQNPVAMNNQTTISSGSLGGMVWDFGDSTQKSTEYNPVHIYIQPGSYTVSLTAESDNGCIDQHLQPVPVNYLPVANFSNDTACALSPTTFLNTSTVTNSSIGQSNWVFENGASDTTFSPQYSYPTAGFKNVSLIVTSTAGCIDTVSNVIRVWELPQPDFSAQPTEGCVPLPVNFLNLSQSADGSIINWSWQLNSNNASTAIQPALIYTEVDKHDVMLMVTTDLGCSNTIIKPLYINVHPLPVAKFTFANSKPDILTPFVEIIDESTLGYKWKYDFGDNTTSTDQNPSHNYPQVGKYKVEQVVESEFGCLDSTYRIIEVNNVYTLYIPNSFTPNNDGLNDEFISVGIGIVEFSIVIYDRWGKMIFSADDMNKSWNGMINTEYAKEDTYFYLVKARDIFKKQHSITGQVSVVY
jgi:gliding motility-associated-like protein